DGEDDEEGGVFSGEKYWRSSSMNQYTDGGWARRDIMTEAPRALDGTDPYHWFTSLQGRNQEPGMFRLEFHPGNHIVRQEIFMDRPPQTGVPVLALVRGVQPMAGAKDVRYRWDSSGDFSVEVAMRRPDALQYEAWSEILVRDPEVLRAFEGDFSGPMNPHDEFTLTYENLLDETKALVRSLTEDKETYYDKVVAIESYLSSDTYLYTLQIPELSKDHPVDDFILNVKRGHCELYASALALMVRNLEIPARLANGYRGGTFDPSDRAYTVTQDMAHVWVEVYFPNHGWVIFDPSPKNDELDDRAISVFQRAVSRIVLKGKLIWYRGVVGFNPRNRFAVVKDAAIGFFRGPSDTQGASRSFTATGAGGRLVFVGLAACGIVAALVFVVRRAGAAPGRKLISIALTREQQQARALRKRLLNRLKHAGVSGANVTVDELRAAIDQFPEEDRRPARQVIEAYNAVRFGRRPLSTDAYNTLRRMIRGVRPAMAPSPAQE
ncbi:MAG: transglutaminase domain-containing protein, partial [Candidatus Hydrogenedentota bacterium]